MIENLLNLVKEQGADAVINNPAIPNEKNEAVLSSATDSVTGELQNALAGGGVQNVLSLFANRENNGGGLSNNPIVQNIIGSFTNKLTSDHGISSSQAGGIAGSLIPSVISKLINKTNDPNDSSFDMNGIISSLTGGGARSGGFDFNSILSKMGAGKLDADGDGQLELSDIVSKITGGQQSKNEEGGGGGVMDMIKGFMK